MTRLALPVLLTASVLLAATLVVEIMQDQPDAAQPPGRALLPASSPPASRTDNVVTQGDRSQKWVATILARPLFSLDRRPPAPSIAKDSGHAVAGIPRLAGILVTPTGRIAIFAATDGGKPIVVPENGRFGAYTVTAIEDGTVTLVGPEGTRRVLPSFASGAEAAAQSAEPGRQNPAESSISVLDLIRNPPKIPIPAAPKK